MINVKWLIDNVIAGTSPNADTHL